jgi:polysaccharide export outer membrane protein
MGTRRKIRRQSKMAKILAAAVLAAISFGASSVANARPGPAGQIPAASQTEVQALVIGSGDLIDVSMFDAPSLSGKFRVDQNGDLEMPLLESIHVAGLTADQAGKLIENRYIQAQILIPEGSRSTVFIEEYANQGITVSGEVKSPGVYPAFGVRMLNDVVTAAGGPTELAASKAIITRSGDRQHSVTVTYNPEVLPRVISETQIFPGDTVVVPRAGIFYVLGAVNKAGGFALNGHDSVTAEKAMALAGGTARAPSLKRAQVVRNLPDGRKEMITVRLDRILKGKAPDIRLQDGDVLYLPTSTARLATQQALTSALGIAGQVTVYKTAY